MELSCPDELFNQTNNPTENLYTFSAFFADTFHVPESMLCDHIFCAVSMALCREAAAREDINSLYREDRSTYYAAYRASECSRHIIMSQGNLEDELSAYKALGILLVSESETDIRNKIINILRFHYPHIYKTVRKHDFKYLLPAYASLDYFLTSQETRYERAVYFYLSFYCSPDWVDQSMVNAIAQNIYEFEYYSPVHADLKTEILHEQKGIRRLKEFITEKYGEIGNYFHILHHSRPSVYNLGCVIENLFHINKLNMDDIYYNYRTLPMDRIYLACLKQEGFKFDSGRNLEFILACIFLQPLLEEYKKAKAMLREYRQENEENQLFLAQRTIEGLKKENRGLRTENRKLTEEKGSFTDTLNQSVNRLKKDYESEIARLNHTVKDLNLQLSKEYNYRRELNKLREFIFSLNTPPVPAEKEALPLQELLADKNIVVIGGPRTWRRKLREHLPMIHFLNGTSTNLDLSYFKNTDCVLFYTGYMSHAIYNKAMNYIRTNQIKFGYLKATNIKLIEAEILDALKQAELL